jgi:HTH-type transcriptional regulator/antitoxin HigA
MDIRPIRNDEDHAAAVALIERYWDAEDGSPEADTLDVLATLVDAYEDTRWPVGSVDPIETTKAHMAATGRTQSDLAEVIGSRPRASEVMARKRPLTINMIRGLVDEWHLPAALLIARYNLRKPKVAAASRSGAHKRLKRNRRQKVTPRKRVAEHA